MKPETKEDEMTGTHLINTLLLPRTYFEKGTDLKYGEKSSPFLLPESVRRRLPHL